MKILVLDVGTSGVRAAVLGDDLATLHDHCVEALPDSPANGLVEFDARVLANTTLDLAREAIAKAGRVDGVAISVQRASTVVWERNGTPVGPALGWQDLRTIGECFMAREHNIFVAPNQSATKAQWLLNTYDPDRSRDLLIGTVDTWIAWNLSGGAAHITDATNVGITGLAEISFERWDNRVLDALQLPHSAMAAIVPSSGMLGIASVLDGAPPIVALLGDQQASLAGQACVHTGDAKITFGTGGMLNVNLGDLAPTASRRNTNGTFPIAAWRVGNETTWGLESIILAAGTNVQWLRDDLQIIDTADQSHDIAAQCADTGDVWYVPALMGLGTPNWDYGARSALFGLTRGTGRPEIVRAVLEGVAHRGADLLDAAIADCGVAIDALRIDGGMSDNPTFVQALANTTQRPVEISPVREATTRGAALFGLLALGHFSTVQELTTTWEPRARIEPNATTDRDRWREAVKRAGQWIPALSSIDF